MDRWLAVVPQRQGKLLSTSTGCAGEVEGSSPGAECPDDLGGDDPTGDGGPGSRGPGTRRGVGQECSRGGGGPAVDGDPGAWAGGGGGARRRGTPGSRRTPWPSFGRAEPRHPAAREGGREGRDEGGEGGEAYHETGVERTDAAATVLGDESDGERRKKRHGEEDEQGAIPRLTGGPHMQRRRLPSRLPHRPGERTAPTRWRLGRAELGHRGSGLRREGERGEKQAAGRETVAGPQTPGRPTTRKGGGGKGRPRLGCAREAGPRERGGGVWGFSYLFSCFSSNSSLECMTHKPSQSNNKMHDPA
jgi:hypothetical protein